MSKWLYEHSPDNLARFILGTEGDKPLICFGINPSTAEPNNLDNTVRRVERFASRNGFDSWIMLNIYPQRATDPIDLHQSLDNALHTLNKMYISEILQRTNLTLWAAWGTVIARRKYLTDCLHDINLIAREYNCHWVSLGNLTKDGHPRHPLYLSYSVTPTNFDINPYLNHAV